MTINMTKNNFSRNIRKIHLIAVCGTAMGALASMLKDMGYQITGSDRHVYPPMSRFLEKKRIPVSDGFTGEYLTGEPDLVVVGNAVSKDNSEVITMNQMGIHFCSMPQAINHFFGSKRKCLLVTGTHGKTTTSSILAWILYTAKLDPSFLIGGILKNFNSNYRVGNGDYIIIEGDEYDTAFFDKGPKFFHYKPHAAVLTSVEFDHADIFENLKHVKKVFNQFLSRIPENSTLFAYDDDKNVANLIKKKKCRIQMYGLNPSSNWCIENISVQPPITRFEIIKSGQPIDFFKTTLVGEHNLTNALAAIAIAEHLKVPFQTIKQAIESFEGVKRRQEIRGKKKGITIIDDFAHHPTAVRETIRAVKPSFPNGRLIAVFEPRTNSSMRNIFQDVYPSSFDFADFILIRKPPLLKKIPVKERFSSEKLVADLKGRHKIAHYFRNTETIIDFLVDEARPGDVILIMSNGGFDNIHERLLNIL